MGFAGCNHYGSVGREPTLRLEGDVLGRPGTEFGNFGGRELLRVGLGSRQLGSCENRGQAFYAAHA